MTIEELAGVTPAQLDAAIALVAETREAIEDEAERERLLDECERRTGWRGVQDAGSANWAARKILDAERELADLKAQTKERIKAAENELARRKAFFEPQIRAWFEAQDLKGKKSLPLDSVTLSSRTVSGGYRFTDREAAIRWAREFCPDAVSQRVVYEIADEEALKRAKFGDGEDVPGLEYVEDRESFSIKAPRAKGEE